MWKLSTPAGDEGGNEESFSAFESFVNREFAKADKDLSGTLGFEEFLSIFQAVKSGMGSAERLRTAFKFFDKDGSGTLSTVELANILSNPRGAQPLSADAARAEAERVMKKFDTNGDGSMSYNEFVGWMCAKA